MKIDYEKEFMQAGDAAKEGFKEKDADPKELKLGIEMEMEHTDSEDIAKKIALDHLAEIPDYYTRLAAMEKEAESDEDESDEDEVEEGLQESENKLKKGEDNED
jgi:hypothetical protein